MSKSDLQRYLLAGAPDVSFGSSSCIEEAGLVRRRNAPRDKRNRLSCDLDIIKSRKRSPSGRNSIPDNHVHYRRCSSDALAAKRRSLNLDSYCEAVPKRKTVHFNLAALPDDHPQQYQYDNEEENCAVGLPRARRCRKHESENSQENLLPVMRINPHLLQLMEISPRTQNEAQRLKKMLKRAVSGPNATFEDLRAYRLAMKKLRQFVQKELVSGQESMETEGERGLHDGEKKSGSSSYSGSRFGTGGSTTTPSVSYLSALNKDRASSKDRSGYASGSGYGSGTGYGSGSGSNYISSKYSGTGGKSAISSLASKFGDTKPLPSRTSLSFRTSDSPSSAYTGTRNGSSFSTASSRSAASPYLATRKYESDAKKPPDIPSTYRTRTRDDATASSKVPYLTTRKSNIFSSDLPSSYSPKINYDSKPTSNLLSKSRERDSTPTTLSSRDNTNSTYSRTNSNLSARTNLPHNESSLRTKDYSLSTTRSRSRDLPNSPPVRDQEFKYGNRPSMSKYSSQSIFDKSKYNSDAKSGSGSDLNKSGYGSGYSSGTGNYKRYSWNRSNSYLKDNDSLPSYRTYSRQNSFLGSDSGSGTYFRSKVHIDDNLSSVPHVSLTSQQKLNDTPKDKTASYTESQKPERPSAFKTAINKLYQESKENDSNENKKPEVLSPNAVKVLPTMCLSDLKLRNRAPADFSSDSEDSGKADDGNNKNTENVNAEGDYSKKKTNEKCENITSVRENSPVVSVTIKRPLRHLSTAPELPLSECSMPTSTIQQDDKDAIGVHDLASSEVKEKEIVSKPTNPCIPVSINTNSMGFNANDKNSSSSMPLPVTESKVAKENCRESQTDHTNDIVGIANKECRKSVLNMDIEPESEDAMRRQQEEKRDEHSRMRKELVDDDAKPLAGFNNSECVAAADVEDSSSDEDIRKEKPHFAPAAEKTSSKSKLVERKHSRGRSDSLRKSGSFRRARDKKCLHTSRTSSTSSSDTENEEKFDRAANDTLARMRKRGSKDELLIYAVEGRRSRNSSETLGRVSSRSSLSKLKSRNNSKGSLVDKSSNSRNSLVGESRLALGGPDTEETVGKIYLSDSKGQHNFNCDYVTEKSAKEFSKNESEKDNNAQKTSQHSSNSISDLSSRDSSESAGEEGCLFSISKSKSFKKPNSPVANMISRTTNNENETLKTDLGERTSPDGKENVADEDENMNDGRDIECSFRLFIPYKKSGKSPLSDNSVNAELNISNCLGVSPASSKSNIVSHKSKSSIADNTECDVSEILKSDVADACPSSKSASKKNLVMSDNGLAPFQWPSGSPELQRIKIVSPVGKENCDPDQNKAVNTTEEAETFQWPDGSPVLSRRYPYFKTQWDTETDTEMEQFEMSDASPLTSKLPELAEDTEDDVVFDWPSSPELSRKITYSRYGPAEYDTQAEATDAFEWPSSPELPKMKDPKYVSYTTDIDHLLNGGSDQDSFSDMEQKLGYTTTVTEEEAIGSPNSELPAAKHEDEHSPTEQFESRNDDSKRKKEKIPKKSKSLREHARKNLSVFIGKLTNVDEILSSVLRPLTFLRTRKSSGQNSDEEGCIQEIKASDVKVHNAQANRAEIDENLEEIDPSAVIIRQKEKREALKAEIIKAVKDGLDDANLQSYRKGDYGTYLDLETPLAEQTADIDGLSDSKKNAIILRTQLSVRARAITEKLLSSEGRELRHALFSLKQIFQDDKDLVRAFVQNDGLRCLVKVGASSDHNYQTYILRALGQVMLYVDGMKAISQTAEVIQWLYSLASSRFRLVAKSALKLLLVFAEYSEYNDRALIRVIHAVGKRRGSRPWSGLMKLLEEKECPDTELQICAMTLVNKTLNGLPDQESYYDQTDCLEDQGIELLIERLLNSPNSDLDLLQQLTIYEAVLAYEDGDDVCRTRTIDPTIRQELRFSTADRDDSNRRQSRRHCPTPSPEHMENQIVDEWISSSDDDRVNHVSNLNIATGLPADDLGGIRHTDAGVTPALRRRRERAESKKTLLKDHLSNESRRKASTTEEGNLDDVTKQNTEISWLLELMHAKKDGEVKDVAGRIASLMEKEIIDNKRKLPIELMADSSVKDILKKLSKGASITEAEEEKLARLDDVSSRIQRAKGSLLNKAHSKDDLYLSKTPEPPKKSENDLYWENLINNLNRPLQLCDLDFTDLTEDDDKDIFTTQQEGIPIPPPPPPAPSTGGMLLLPTSHEGNELEDEDNTANITPPQPVMNGSIPPPPPHILDGSYGVPLAPPLGHNFGISLHTTEKPHKTKKTIKLFWKEIRDDILRKSNTIWNNAETVNIDTQKLELLFESKAKDINAKKQDQKGIKEIIVLDSKRSNMINIGMTKLPPPRTIKTAILKMDSSIINREGIEKLLSTMLPTPEEKHMIQEAAISNPELPLGSAEQFLMMLASITELPERLKLWLFKLEFENMEKEIAEPLMDLKQGITDLQENTTFAIVMSVLLAMGNFLNGTDSKGFQIEYLAKVPEVKDTVHKHSLLHHLCHIVIEKYPQTSDLYSELGAITRASRVDFEELQNNIEKMENECKASWDYLKAIAKHDGPTQMKLKMSEFLADGAERIIVLGIIYRRVMHRFQRFLKWLGLPPNVIIEAKAQQMCAILSEFALEYRTCRERVTQQIEKKADQRERNKTKCIKMITEKSTSTSKPKTSLKNLEKFKSHEKKTTEEEADSDLRQLLNYSDVSDTEAIRGKNTWRRKREGRTRSKGDESMSEIIMMDMEGIDDALLHSLVKTVTKGPNARSTPRERKRSRNPDKKSLRRTLGNGISEEERKTFSTTASQKR